MARPRNWKMPDQKYRPDTQPGFWPEYKAPSSAVSALVQMPLYRIDGEALSAAVFKDWQDARRAANGGSDAR